MIRFRFQFRAYQAQFSFTTSNGSLIESDKKGDLAAHIICFQEREIICGSEGYYALSTELSILHVHTFFLKCGYDKYP